MNKGGYDVVFANPCPYTNIPILVRFLQIPSVYYLHEPFGPASERQFNRPYLKTNTKWRELSKRLDPFHVLYAGRLQSTRIESVKQTTRLLANSRYTQQHMEQHYGVDAPVCYYGVDIEGFSPIAGMEKENCVLSIGELTPRKGFGFLIESLEHLPPDESPVLRLGCNWVDPDEKRYIEGVAARAKVELQILTNLTTPQLTLEYNRALLCVYSPIAEPLGLVPLESMACGTPVVGVAEGGVRETVRHNETGLLTRRNAHSFAEAVKTLISDPARREQMAHQGRLYVEKHWRWDRSVLELERHLANAAQS
jgi:glycosyltransferase involved in cell wall biosynthesis